VLPASRRALHDADDAPHISRVQSDRWFIQYEQGVTNDVPSAVVEIDPLYFAAGQSA